MTHKGRTGFGHLPETLCPKKWVWLNWHTKSSCHCFKGHDYTFHLRYRNRNTLRWTSREEFAKQFQKQWFHCPSVHTGTLHYTRKIQHTWKLPQHLCNKSGFNYQLWSRIQSKWKRVGFGGVAQESNNIQALRGPSKYSGSLWWQVGARDLAEIQIALEQASSLHPPAVLLHNLGLHTTF